MSSRTKTLYIFENVQRERLFVSKNHNFQTVATKPWWKDVHHVITKHFDSTDDLDAAVDEIKRSGTKWNAR